MRFNLTALSLTVGLFWGGSLLIVALANLIWPDYGQAFLDLAASIYPGYHAGTTIWQVITGTLYGFVDGAIGGERCSAGSTICCRANTRRKQPDPRMQ